MATIIKPLTDELIDPAELFGKDASKLIQACVNIFHNTLPSYKYEFCYHSSSKPRLADIKAKQGLTEDFSTAHIREIELWRKNYPDEYEKEQQSLESWEDFCAKQFRIIYGIAKRHHVYLVWHSESGLNTNYPDRWTVLQNGKEVAKIHCM